MNARKYKILLGIDAVIGLWWGTIFVCIFYTLGVAKEPTVSIAMTELYLSMILTGFFAAQLGYIMWGIVKGRR